MRYPRCNCSVGCLFCLPPQGDNLGWGEKNPAAAGVSEQSRAQLATGADNLVFARQVFDRRAPDMNQTGEREQQEQGHTQHQVNAENKCHAIQML